MIILYFILVVLGTMIFMLGLGLMIKFRTSLDNGRIGVIAAQVGKYK